MNSIFLDLPNDLPFIISSSPASNGAYGNIQCSLGGKYSEERPKGTSSTLKDDGADPKYSVICFFNYISMKRNYRQNFDRTKKMINILKPQKNIKVGSELWITFGHGPLNQSK